MTSTQPTITIDLVRPHTSPSPNSHPHKILTKENAQPVLQATLHSILFHRLFGPLKPQTFDVLDAQVTMPGVKDAKMEAMVDSKVAAFLRAVDGGGGGSQKRGQISVTLSEKQQKKAWFQVYDEEVPWERWIINAEMRQSKSDLEREQLESTLAATLTKAVMTMLVHATSAETRAIVPQITEATTISPFPLSIAVSVGGDILRKPVVPQSENAMRFWAQGCLFRTLRIWSLGFTSIVDESLFATMLRLTLRTIPYTTTLSDNPFASLPAYLIFCHFKLATDGTIPRRSWVAEELAPDASETTDTFAP
ncbi:hypothetical protein HMN09_01131100 [Mycena chlorophos]|uniref:Autophagy-related protein 101 n=1 Tax=Mycena chlorophos TaxID=658473 RepID=A0A8H6SBU4_MYCCL|nr:hypothetical protein HMN09_01131100 [Mycena chlorophos]